MRRLMLGALLAWSIAMLIIAQATAEDRAADVGHQSAGRKHAVIYVMPNALANPGADSSQVVVDSAHNGKEPQVAKIYQELQHRAECKDFSENMLKDKADYYLLLPHGGGKGNRWAVSDKHGDVIASGETFTLGSSVKDACLAMAKNWQGAAN